MSNQVDTSTFEYRDMFGREIKVGDYIVYGAVDGRSGTLRAGRVIELTHSKDKVSIYDRETGEHRHDYEPKIKCESWSNFRSRDWGGKEKSGKQKAVSLGFLDRLIVVPAEIVSDKVKKDLDGPLTDRW